MTGKTKRELILEICAERLGESWRGLDSRLCADINRRLTAIYGPGGQVSYAFMARLFLAAGQSVEFDSELPAAPAPPDEGGEEFDGLLKFDSLSTAERLLRALNGRFQDCCERGDSPGAARYRAMVERAGLRARLISACRHTPPERRAQLIEFTGWIALWLRTPELFEDWIALRVASADYRQRFL